MITMRNNSGRALPLSSANDGKDAFSFDDSNSISNPVAAAPKAIHLFTAPDHCMGKALCNKKHACQYVGCISNPKYDAAPSARGQLAQGTEDRKPETEQTPTGRTPNKPPAPQALPADAKPTASTNRQAKDKAPTPPGTVVNGAAQDLAQQVGATIKRGKAALKGADAVLQQAMKDQKANAAASGKPVKPNKGGGAKKDLAPSVTKSQTPPSAGAPAPSTTPEEDTMATKKTAAKKTAAKAPAKKAAAAPARTASARGFQDDQTITLVAKENPKREGTTAHGVFALYKTGMTVGAFREKADKLDDNNSGAHLRWDTKKGFIKIK